MSAPIAVVTGAGGGMGAAIAAELARTHQVHALARRPESVAALPTGVVRHLGDLRSGEFLDEVAAAVGEVDVVVHAAAIGDHVSVEHATGAAWLAQLGTNVVAPAELTRRLLPGLRRRRGTVVFIGSGASTRPVPGSALYTASKHALRGLADVLRIDEAAHRVRVVTIAPGQTDTPMLRQGMDEADYAPERYIRPESVALTVRFVVDAPADVHLTDIAVRPRVEIARL
ncbi:SDR family oxidoreductase [Propionibacteriaceae bacterium G57]|uniref:SDR family oxidoreductase n=1 Tax=Aestuariimicrobium sp. G57 TaxID=3418485 RepID=UPI003DA79836